jgi:hypothetical protein
MGLAIGDPREVDHRDGDPLNNRRSNLRVVTSAQNAQNLAATLRSSRYRGVDWHKPRKRWRARATVGGVVHHLGHFSSEEQAAEAGADVSRAAHAVLCGALSLGRRGER